MATPDTAEEKNLERMNENLEKVEALSQRLVQALSHRNPPAPELNGPGQELYARAAASYWHMSL